MASRRLSKSAAAAIKAHNLFSRPSLHLRSCASGHFNLPSSSLNSFLFRPDVNSFSSVTQAAAHGQLFPICFQFPSPRFFSSDTEAKTGEESKDDALSKYGHDLTELAWQGQLCPVIRRNDEIGRCIQVLCRMTKRNHVIVGEPGVGKTAIAEG